MTSQSIADASQWPDNFDMITWKMISNLLYVDFIHGDIDDLWPLLLMWINFNPSMDKQSHAQ